MSRTAATFSPPIKQAQTWLAGMTFPPDRPLINVSQAAPVDPPPLALRQAIADIALNDDSAHLYGPILGLPDLRAELAAQCSAHYAGVITGDQVAITSGCNQAFAAAISALTGQGDEVIIPTPWYFNHKMWLDMAGVIARPLATGTTLLPDPDRAAAMITPRTRAIVLVSPNNPAGVEYPADLIRSFLELARRHGLKLILDETYRDFHALKGPPHALFADPDWHDTLIHLYSFSKAYRLTGHRVGAMIAATGFLAEAEKFLDTVTICPNQIGQRAALWGMRNLGPWLADERDEILARRAAMQRGFATLAADGWQLLGNGAYFAYASHPYPFSSQCLTKRLLAESGILVLPGSMFMPDNEPNGDPNGDPNGERCLRIAFANINRDQIATLFTRLQSLPF